MYEEKPHPLIEQLNREHAARDIPTAGTIAALTERVRAASEKYHDVKNSRPDLHMAGETEIDGSELTQRERRLKAHGYATKSALSDYESAISELQAALARQAASKTANLSRSFNL
ncbi:MAG TPA: hypothetical protein VFC78_11090 [Tepidisphaeraceae bacterium]|nr:hypothetical protein [Tepidisphaeraceae bacterium]